MYICYTTMWSEGVVVVKDTDTRFAIGYDPINGHIIYVDSLQELKDTATYEVEAYTNDMAVAVRRDTALYPRCGIDHKEIHSYNQTRINHIKNSRNDSKNEYPPVTSVHNSDSVSPT